MSDVADDEDHHLLGKAGRANVLETLNAQGPQGIAEFQEARQSNQQYFSFPTKMILDVATYL